MAAMAKGKKEIVNIRVWNDLEKRLNFEIRVVFKNKALKIINKKLKVLFVLSALGFKNAVYLYHMCICPTSMLKFIPAVINRLWEELCILNKKLLLIPIISSFLWESTILPEYCSKLTYFLNRTLIVQGKNFLLFVLNGIFELSEAQKISYSIFKIISNIRKF